VTVSHFFPPIYPTQTADPFLCGLTYSNSRSHGPPDFHEIITLHPAGDARPCEALRELFFSFLPASTCKVVPRLCRFGSDLPLPALPLSPVFSFSTLWIFFNYQPASFWLEPRFFFAFLVMGGSLPSILCGSIFFPLKSFPCFPKALWDPLSAPSGAPKAFPRESGQCLVQSLFKVDFHGSVLLRTFCAR